MASKERLDLTLVARGLAESRQKAQALIMAGRVTVDGAIVDKAGTKIPSEARIDVKGKDLAYVSRGGLKLQGAFASFGLDMEGAVVCDIGASTGGFVDCALQHGAAKVYAIDVGYGQLDWSLRQDPRVESRERTNGRYLTRDDFPQAMDWVTTDVAFISLEKILPAAHAILKEGGQVLALIKPQFEAGRDHVGKNGVVRDPKVHQDVLDRLLAFGHTLGLGTLGLTHSPIQGPKGNIEYLWWSQKGAAPGKVPSSADHVVTAFAHFKEPGDHHA